MISTVTTSTVTTIVSVTAVTGMVGSLAIAGVIAFLVLLITREMATAGSGGRTQAIARGLNIGIVPLGLAFLMIAVAQVLSVLH